MHYCLMHQTIRLHINERSPIPAKTADLISPYHLLQKLTASQLHKGKVLCI